MNKLTKLHKLVARTQCEIHRSNANTLESVAILRTLVKSENLGVGGYDAKQLDLEIRDLENKVTAIFAAIEKVNRTIGANIFDSLTGDN